MKAIFCTAILQSKSGVTTDLSERVSRLTYERDYEKENAMTLVIEQSYTERVQDLLLRNGDTLIVHYGYKGGKQSGTHSVRVTDITRRYKGLKMEVTIKGRDEGTIMKKTASVRVWKDVTLSQIARDIAGRYGLTYQEEEPTTKVYSSLPQGQRDDWAFLQSVVAMEPSGAYLCYISDGVLYLQRRALGAQSTWTIDYEYGTNGTIHQIDVSVTESQKTASGNAKTTAMGYDLDQGEMKVKESSQDDFDSTTGEYLTEFSADSDELGTDFEDDPDAQLEQDDEYGDRITSPSADEDELTGMASGGYQSATIKRKELKIVMEGLPDVLLNTIITLRGVDEEDAGNYLVKAVTEDIVPGSGYKTSITAHKNASRRPSKSGQSSVEQSKVNKSVGDEVQVERPTKKIQYFDADANPL